MPAGEVDHVGGHHQQIDQLERPIEDATVEALFLAEGNLLHPVMPQKPNAGKQLTSRMQQESASSGLSGLRREQERQPRKAPQEPFPREGIGT